MSPRLKKVLGDLVEQPWRTAMVFMAICLGTGALTVALGSRSVLLREIPRSFQESVSPAAVFWLENVSDEVLEDVRNLPGVEEADARRLVRTRVQVSPGDWRTMLLFGVRDFSDLRVSVFSHEEGQMPPGRGSILVERSGIPVLGSGVGSDIELRIPGGDTKRLSIEGTVHDASLAPGWQDNVAYAYASRETLVDLGLGEQLDQLRIHIAADRAQARLVASEVRDWLLQAGHDVFRVEVPVRRHPHADHMSTMLILLTALSSLALILSGSLTASVIAALLNRQGRHIGIMKTIGARSSAIAMMYLALIGSIAVPAAGLGLCVGSIGYRMFSLFASKQLNVELVNRSAENSVLVFVFLAGIIIPLGTAAIPIRSAVKGSIRRALLNSVFVMSGARSNVPHQIRLAGIRATLALRYCFCQPMRLLLTLVALSIGGATLISTSNVYLSLVSAVDRSLARRFDDIDIRLQRPIVSSTVLPAIEAIPGVRQVEAWGGGLVGVSMDPSVGMTRGRYGLLAPPTDTRMFKIPVVEGRWVTPRKTGEIVVNRNLQAREPTLVVGTDVYLSLGKRTVRGQVVGVIEEVSEPSVFTNETTFDELAGSSEAVGVIRVSTDSQAPADVAARIEDIIVDAGSMPALQFTRSALRQAMVDHFSILLALLLAASFSAIIVGGLALGTSMTLNVIERHREIGIVRALV